MVTAQGQVSYLDDDTQAGTYGRIAVHVNGSWDGNLYMQAGTVYVESDDDFRSLRVNSLIPPFHLPLSLSVCLLSPFHFVHH